ncbi:MAG: S1 RNA-binding domain-containing protein [Myxococcales bacterium]|nr:S1 RNA-binding domain-containing protein [Myxococcales bacterium]
MSTKLQSPKDLLLSDEEAEFENLFDQNAIGAPGPRVRRGDEVSGRIIRVSGDVAFIDLGGKAEGILEVSLEEAETLKPGTTITAIVTSTDGAVRMRRGLGGRSGKDFEAVAQAHQLGLPVEGKITGRNKGGFEVDVSGARGFLPLGQLALEQIPEDKLDGFVGSTHTFKIIEFDPKARRLVLSRNALLREQREVAAAAIWETLEVGQIRQGTVRSVQEYGAFVDLGGVDGLVHVGELDWVRVKNPNDLVKVGQAVTVVVVSLDPAKKRIGLSMKATGQDPWKTLALKVGDAFEGAVTRVERFGAFIEITHGVEGLVHVSEMSHERRIRHPSDLVKAGDRVKVAVLDVDHAGRKLALSMKALAGDPWETAATDLPVGARITGNVERVAPFGVFVRVGPAITALLPGSETGLSPAELERRYRVGSPVDAEIIAIDVPNRRMTLSITASATREERETVSNYQRQATPERRSNFGTFADLLANSSAKKK